MTPCTNPNAPLYQFDLIVLEILESNNIDLPCTLIVQSMLVATCAVAFIAFCIVAVSYSFFQNR